MSIEKKPLKSERIFEISWSSYKLEQLISKVSLIISIETQLAHHDGQLDPSVAICATELLETVLFSVMLKTPGLYFPSTFKVCPPGN